MTNERAAEILREYNEWRRHEGEPYAFAYDGKTLGKAIDMAIDALIPKTKPTMEDIAEAVCRESSVTMDELHDVRRYRDYAEARYMFSWITWHYTGQSTPTIARFLGLKAHASVLHGIYKGDEWMAQPILNPEWVKKTNKIVEQIKRYENGE